MSAASASSLARSAAARSGAARTGAARSAAAPAPSRDLPGRNRLAVLEAPAQAPSRRGRRAVAVVVAALAVALVLLGLAALPAVLGARQVELDRLDVALESARTEHQRLVLEVAELEAPGRVMAEATRLGLEAPTEVRYVHPPTNPAVAPEGR